MNLEQITTFLQVYQIGSFQETANQMFLPQPTISHRITQLERELGKPLLIRGKGKVRLTEEGKAFLPYARHILGSLQEGREAVASVEQGSAGKLTLGSNNSFASSVLPEVLDSFMTEYPKVALKVQCYASPTLVRFMKQREIQLAITRYTSNDRGITYRSVYSESTDLIVSPSHPFAKRKKVDIEEILKETFITYQKDTQYRDLLDSTLNQIQLNYITKFETNNLGLIKHFIKQNAGVHLSGSLYMRNELARKELVQVKIEHNPFAQSQVFIAHLKDEANSLDQLFIKHFEKQINSQLNRERSFLNEVTI
ncbi:LysR family transcriptional regulator [Paenibacillus agricola]|uniref:LysR family transcriptional regulator n=1 Tax=Paenibacillus agricola TaxID=2716264 RepID=A0ABX0J3U0_9BACL|nr:LysR family transcriptional regulator [Paenibacillus agricola]NHN29488.1 LysR family transcriptional regulator [Paenibacillus agricola]